MPEDLFSLIRFAILKYRDEEWEHLKRFNGAYPRDVDIYLLASFGDFRHHEIGQYFGLSERRVGQILKTMKEGL